MIVAIGVSRPLLMTARELADRWRRVQPGTPDVDLGALQFASLLLRRDRELECPAILGSIGRPAMTQRVTPAEQAAMDGVPIDRGEPDLRVIDHRSAWYIGNLDDVRGFELPFALHHLGRAGHNRPIPIETPRNSHLVGSQRDWGRPCLEPSIPVRCLDRD